ncbi:peptidoglycan DD-metalloendopeptidase family protein [Breoghania sp. L-A4]|uniref:peptidoglycan DD-metalloendopeptidase family protein n=1 Tax=Breoghania sp. L-A4 TaxID=2304600 RepID=UPI000E35D77F|nr:peptidoglycan DD-metalloendopeptidase family protein [Breoghania sp. L-A4]AXS40538.1 LysM peptidoglycan-binding domain-containing protein [Breoghania sp. L-A4]
MTLERGESVQTASRRYGVPVSAIQAANGLNGDPNFPREGQRLIIPSYNHGSSVQANALPTPQRPQAPDARDTASNVKPVRTRTVRVASNADVVPDPKPMRPRVVNSAPVRAVAPSQVSRVEAPLEEPRRKPAASAAYTRTTRATETAPAAPIAVSPKLRPKVSRPVRSEPERAASREEEASGNQIANITAQPDPETTESVGDSNANRFRWPVRGRVISSFGRKAGGARNDGINLAVPEGAQIRAVESGTVIYSGNELKGYGNLVLIRHEDGWVSAYAHNSELMVRRGDTVRRGDVVAAAGSTGSVSQPQLHFELRRGNKPVDPLQYLSKV